MVGVFELRESAFALPSGVELCLLAVDAFRSLGTTFMVLFDLLFLLSLLLLVGSLLSYHLLLLTLNLTTWEQLAWRRISYLKVRPRRGLRSFCAAKKRIGHGASVQRQFFFRTWKKDKARPSAEGCVKTFAVTSLLSWAVCFAALGHLQCALRGTSQ